MSEHSRDYLSDHLYENSSNYPSPKDSSSNSSGAERFKVIEQLVDVFGNRLRVTRMKTVPNVWASCRAHSQF